MENIGYSAVSPMFVERCLKMALYPAGYIPADVMDIENAIKQVEPDERQLVIHKYQWYMSLAELAERHKITKWQVRRRVEDAEYSVHIAYCNLGTNMINPITVGKLSLQHRS